MLRCTNFVTFARRKGFYTADSSRVFYIHKSLAVHSKMLASFGNVSIRNGDSFQRSILCSLFIKDKPSDNCHLSFPSR
jgi:hypothetical protein